MKLLQRLSGALVKKKGESAIPVELREKIRLWKKRMGYFFRNPSPARTSFDPSLFQRAYKG